MFWRLFAVRLVLACVLSFSAIVFSVHLSNEESRNFEVQKRQKLEILELRMENVFDQLEADLAQRADFYRELHSELRQRIISGQPVDLSGWQQEVERFTKFPVDLFLIGPDFVVADTTYPPDMGLDFKLPYFIDAQETFRMARQTSEVLVGAPTLEAVSNNYKIYTMASLPDGRFLQLGFVDPQLKQFFEVAQRNLEAADGVQHAEMFIDSAGTALSALADNEIRNGLDPNSLEKAEYIKALQSYLDAEYDYVKLAKKNAPYEVLMDPRTGSGLIYVYLGDKELSPTYTYRYVAKVVLQSTPISWLVLWGYEIGVLLLFGVVVLLIWSMVEIRYRLIRPLIQLQTAMSLEKSVPDSFQLGVAGELRTLAQNYNHYRELTATLTQELRDSAVTDPLTGLWNRGALATIHDRLQGIAQRNDQLFALAFLDLDHFKEFNDRYGHEGGDDALRTLSEVVTTVFKRPTDAAIRYGGEEFLVYYAGDSVEGVIKQAEALLVALRKRAVPHEGNQPQGVLTLSLGLVICDPAAADDYQSLISQADAALYQAKDEGRDQMVVRNLTVSDEAI